MIEGASKDRRGAGGDQHEVPVTVGADRVAGATEHKSYGSDSEVEVVALTWCR